MDQEFDDKRNELLRDARKADEEDKKLLDNMLRLMASHDFDMYVRRVLEPRIQKLGSDLLIPSGGQDGMVRSEFVKGALYGLCLARDLPSEIITATQGLASDAT